VILTKKNAKELLSRSTYQRFIRAYGDDLDPNGKDFDRILGKFVALVKVKYPEFYNDWEGDSFVINDLLQTVLVELLRDETSTYDIFNSSVSKILYQSRLIKNSLHEWGKDKNLLIEEELLAMFTWYCQFEHQEWFMSFHPIEWHMGGYNWKQEIEDRWKEFLTYYSTVSLE